MAGFSKAARQYRRAGKRAVLRAAAAFALVFAVSRTASRAFLPSPGAAPAPRVGKAAPATVSQAKVAEVVTSMPGAAQPTQGAGTQATAEARLGGLSPNLVMMAALPIAKVVQSAATGTRGGKTQRSAMMSQPEDVKDQVMTSVLPVLGIFFGWMGLMYAIQHGAIGGLSAEQAMYGPIVATFIAGYGVIVLEEQTEISKASAALVLGVSMWALVGTGLGLSPEVFDKDVKDTLEDVSEVVFFLLGALTIVEIMDAHRGFDIITNAISAKKSRDLLLVIGVLTFVLSSVLNNLTVVIVMVSLLQKVIKDDTLRQRIGGTIVIASNAGGAWTPIGDITTTMMYIGGQVTTVPLIGNLFIPSVLCLIGSLGYEYLQMDGEEEFERPPKSADDGEKIPGQSLVFWGGLTGMVSVPVFTALTECPAWSGMMLVLGLLGVITSVLHGPEDEKYSLKGALARVEVPDALFFLGVLFAVGGLERIGLLKEFAIQLSQLVPSEAIVAILLGFASAVVDNVPLVAATQGMYDLTAHPANDPLWNLICYCAATGGSLLVIGSAAGVAFMGMEKGVSFGWYFGKVAPAALVGYLLGVGGVLAQQALGFSFA